MSFKLQHTEEMARFILSDAISNEEAGILVRILETVAAGGEVPTKIPQPLTHVVPIFAGQIEKHRSCYLAKVEASAERMRKKRQRERERYAEQREQSVTGVTPTRYAEQREQREQSVTSVTPQRYAEQREQREQSVTSVTPPCYAPKTKQNKAKQIKAVDPNTDPNPNTNSKTYRIGVDSYDDIYSAFNDPIEIAVEFCQEANPRSATSAYRRHLTRIGEDAFRSVLAKFWGEVRSGEEPRSRGAAFMARLKQEETIDLDEAEEAKAACAALAKKASTKGKPHE